MIGVNRERVDGRYALGEVFVLGEAELPGSYTAAASPRVTSALFASGGVKPIGSLRDIQLKRQARSSGVSICYDLLVKGDTSDDARLLPGDVIFIPPVGPTVSVDGEVNAPAIYEVKSTTTMSELLGIAGGVTPDADRGRSLTRVDERNRRVVLDVDLQQASMTELQIRNGDSIRVAKLRPQIDSGGDRRFLHRPGVVAWHDGLRLSDVIGSIDELRPNADHGYILIRRESGPSRHVEVLSADLTQALAARARPRTWR